MKTATKRLTIIFLTAVLMVFLPGCSVRTADSPEENKPPEQKSEEITAMPDEFTQTAEPDLATRTPQPPPLDSELVKVTDYIPTIAVELKYASAENFTGSVIYAFSDAYLRYGTVKKLSEVQKKLERQGLGIKIWDAFRPASAQFRLWEIYPDATYVANPNKGFSSHSCGNTVDITLIDANGNEVEMPTGFDDFTAKSDRDYADCGETAKQNALLLENLMTAHDFKPYWGEWWHFSDNTAYEVEEEFEPEPGE